MNDVLQRIGLPMMLQIAIESWNEVFLLLLILIMMIGVRRDKTDELRKKVKIPLTQELILFFAVTFVYDLCDIIDICFGGMPTPLSYYCIRIGVFGYYTAGGLQTLLLLYVINKYIAETLGGPLLKKSLAAFRLLQIPNFLLLLITPITGVLYRISTDNDYERAWGYWVWQSVTILTFIFMAFVIIAKWSGIGKFLKQITIAATLLPMLALITSPFLPGVSLNNILVSITALIVFIIYEKNKTEVTIKYGYELEKAKTELAQSRLALEEAKSQTLMAQIQPHFINNSLMAIRARCFDYPEIYESITDFSRYLRSNFEALGDTRLILFEKEMQNIEAYLSLEKANYGDRLNVGYDIAFDDFLVPALSVQPLVENAVRHGVGTYDKGGTVTISVHRDGGNTVIEVKDEGLGKKDITPQQTDRRGIGIENVRKRLTQMSDGRLDIISGENGTTARITISDPQMKKESDQA